MLVIVEDGGGLANRLFVFANVIVTGLETGHRVANPAFRRWADCFEGTRGDDLAIFPRRRTAPFDGPVAARVAASLSFRASRLLRGSAGAGPVRAIVLEWPEQCDLDEGEIVADLRRRRLVFLKGWLFRNPPGIDKHATLLRNFFKPVAKIRSEADRIVDRARASLDILVGVHVRHSDYREFEGGKYFYPFPTYVALMSAVAATIAPRRVSFLVCSDEAQDPLAAVDLQVTYSKMGPVHDLWALSRCDLLMGPPSTFSAWASFLGQVPLWQISDPDLRPDKDRFQVHIPVPSTPEDGS